MSDDPMVVRPPHYGTRRFGIECIALCDVSTTTIQRVLRSETYA
jgi:hypothetical protein